MPAAKANPHPWRIEQKPLQIVDANNVVVAKLTSLDLANAELICACVNRSAHEFPALLRDSAQVSAS